MAYPLSARATLLGLPIDQRITFYQPAADGVSGNIASLLDAYQHADRDAGFPLNITPPPSGSYAALLAATSRNGSDTPLPAGASMALPLPVRAAGNGSSGTERMEMASRSNKTAALTSHPTNIQVGPYSLPLITRANGVSAAKAEEGADSTVKHKVFVVNYPWAFVPISGANNVAWYDSMRNSKLGDFIGVFNAQILAGDKSVYTVHYSPEDGIFGLYRYSLVPGSATQFGQDLMICFNLLGQMMPNPEETNVGTLSVYMPASEESAYTDKVSLRRILTEANLLRGSEYLTQEPLEDERAQLAAMDARLEMDLIDFRNL